MLEDNDLLQMIALNSYQHSRDSKWWNHSNNILMEEIGNKFKDEIAHINLDSIGTIKVEKIDFGSITSAQLFGLDELIIFAWYQLNKQRYKKVLDLGANIGLHSLVLSKIGCRVVAYEPDPLHLEYFRRTLEENDSIENVEVREKAIGIESGQFDFTRVIGNTTGSHITGAKSNVYGDTKTFKVHVDSIKDVINERFDFIKMDVEGYEAKLITSLKKQDLVQTEIILEVGNPINAELIYKWIEESGVNAFSQKKNWAKVTNLIDLPTSHREGSLFLTTENSMNWKAE